MAIEKGQQERVRWELIVGKTDDIKSVNNIFGGPVLA
jgi:hypothetical protein